MILNKYYIIQLGSPAIDPYLVHTIESAESVRTNNISPNKFVVKLPVGASVPEIFNAWLEYNHAGILIEMAKPEWVHTMPE